jgi:diadenosine tetraphosphate (Ap4A) HIT family hydrolase
MDCVFCRILAGEAEASVVHEDARIRDPAELDAAAAAVREERTP